MRRRQGRAAPRRGGGRRGGSGPWGGSSRRWWTSRTLWGERPGASVGSVSDRTQREGEAERASALRDRLGPDRPAVGLHDPAAGREADAAAFVVAAAPLEHLEDRGPRGQPDAVVAHAEGPVRLTFGGGDRHDRRCAVVELQRVADQVLKD